jgi:hypothetical protein
MGRRSKGEGAIYLLGDKRWWPTRLVTDSTGDGQMAAPRT